MKTTQNLQISSDAMAALLQEVLHLAKKRGASEANVGLNYSQGFSVDVRMGGIETLAFNEDKGISLTFYLGQSKGSASSTDITHQALETLVDAAYEIAKVSAKDPCFGLPDKELMGKTYPQLDLYHPWELSPTEAIEKALACEAYALNMDPRISNSEGVNVSTYNSLHGFANTAGGQGLVYSSRHNLSCSVIAKEGECMQRDYDYTTARKESLLADFNLVAKTAAERAISRLNAKKLPTQKIPVLFSSRVSSSLLSSLISAISGGNLYRKHSFLQDSLGKKIFPDFIKIYEQPHLPLALGSSPFDGEGVLTRNNVFVEEGILRQYVLGSYSARKLGLNTTANSDGVHNLTLEPTTTDLKALLKLMDKGLLVTELMGQGVNILTGDYSRGASGFWVEKGEIQFPVEEITIAGSLKSIFLDIVAVGADFNPNLATRCGSLLIKEMTIAGH